MKKDIEIDKPSYSNDKSVVHNGNLLEILSKDFRNFQDVMTHFKTTEQQRHIYKLLENTPLDPG